MSRCASLPRMYERSTPSRVKPRARRRAARRRCRSRRGGRSVRARARAKPHRQIRRDGARRVPCAARPASERSSRPPPAACSQANRISATEPEQLRRRGRDDRERRRGPRRATPSWRPSMYAARRSRRRSTGTLVQRDDLGVPAGGDQRRRCQCRARVAARSGRRRAARRGARCAASFAARAAPRSSAAVERGHVQRRGPARPATARPPAGRRARAAPARRARR